MVSPNKTASNCITFILHVYEVNKFDDVITQKPDVIAKFQ